MTSTDSNVMIVEPLEAAFSVLPMPRLYNEGPDAIISRSKEGLQSVSWEIE
jgi:hypothetical protein